MSDDRVDEVKKNILSPSQWVRILYMVFYAVACWVLLFVILSQGKGERSEAEPVPVQTVSATPGMAADAAPGPQMQFLTIETQPEEAHVRVNGVSQGLSPVRIEVAAGATLHVQAEKAGYASVESQVEIAKGQERMELSLSVFDAGAAEPETKKKSVSGARGRPRTPLTAVPMPPKPVSDAPKKPVEKPVEKPKEPRKVTKPFDPLDGR